MRRVRRRSSALIPPLGSSEPSPDEVRWTADDDGSAGTWRQVRVEPPAPRPQPPREPRTSRSLGRRVLGLAIMALFLAGGAVGGVLAAREAAGPDGPRTRVTAGNATVSLPRAWDRPTLPVGLPGLALEDAITRTTSDGAVVLGR